MGGHRRRSPHRRAVVAADGRSSGHLAASLGASTARLGAALAVIHVMRAALFRAPSADVRAQLARLLGERAVAGDRIGAQPADRRALDAAGWTVIGALSAGHVRETDAARGCAVVAGVDAVHGAWLKEMVHCVFPWLEIGRKWRARDACAVISTVTRRPTPRSISAVRTRSSKGGDGLVRAAGRERIHFRMTTQTTRPTTSATTTIGTHGPP